jgi:hypothetical protein
LTASVGYAGATRFVQQDRIGNSQSTVVSVGVANTLCLSEDSERLAEVPQHLRHERKAGEAAVLVEGGEDFARCAKLDEVTRSEA